MLTEDLKIQFSELLPSIQFEDGGEWLNAYVIPEEFKAFADAYDKIRTEPKPKAAAPAKKSPRP